VQEVKQEVRKKSKVRPINGNELREYQPEQPTLSLHPPLSMATVEEELAKDEEAIRQYDSTYGQKKHQAGRKLKLKSDKHIDHHDDKAEGKKVEKIHSAHLKNPEKEPLSKTYLKPSEHDQDLQARKRDRQNRSHLKTSITVGGKRVDPKEKKRNKKGSEETREVEKKKDSDEGTQSREDSRREVRDKMDRKSKESSKKSNENWNSKKASRENITKENKDNHKMDAKSKEEDKKSSGGLKRANISIQFGNRRGAIKGEFHSVTFT